MIRKWISLIFSFAAVCSIAPCGGSALEVVNAQYHADVHLPQYLPLYHEGWNQPDKDGQPIQYAHDEMQLGGYLHVFFQNVSDKTVQVDDVLLGSVSEGVHSSEGLSSARGVSLKEGIRWGGNARSGIRDAHLCFSKLPKSELDKLHELGEPVWWKVNPVFIEPGRIAEVVIRLRRNPKVSNVAVTVLAGVMTFEATVDTRQETPRLQGLSFSQNLDTVFLYARHPKGKGMIPVQVIFDGQVLTDRCVVGNDPSMEVIPICLSLERPLEKGSVHYYQVTYPDSLSAAAVQRAWSDQLAYGMWGSRKKGQTSDEQVREYLTNMSRHNINVHMGMGDPRPDELMLTEDGIAFCQSIGIRGMSLNFGNMKNPFFYFLMDEPDASDFSLHDVPDVHKRLGALGMGLVERSAELHTRDTKTPHLLNIDNTYKPENWYMYAQLPDVLCADPYFQGELESACFEKPERLESHSKPTYVLAASTICAQSCAPKPLHIILQSCRHERSDGKVFRFPTPEEKRVELYYALLAGAKGFSYWWYTPHNEFHGCGTDLPEAKPLYEEIGRLGAEVRSVGDLITRSCPAHLETIAPRDVKTAVLLVGMDTMILLCVNENIRCHLMGTDVTPVEDVKIECRIPKWLKDPVAFEVTWQGTKDVAFENNQDAMRLELGVLSLTRMVVITNNQQLRSEIQSRYLEEFAEKIALLTAQSLRN